jgi:predicted nucleic acid-binding protein
MLGAWRRGRISEGEARQNIRNLLSLAYILHPTPPLVEHAFDIAQQYAQRIYDCFYVALAEREGLPFWTSDERLFNARSGQLPFVRFIADYVPLR